MTDRDELREKVSIAIDTAICTGDQSSVAMELTSEEIKTLASAAIDIVLEEAARVADANALEAWDFGADETRGLMRLQAADIAAAIREMKGKG